MNIKEAMSWTNAKGKAMMLKEAQETGRPLVEIVAEHSMPDIAILNDDLTFEYNGQQVTFDQYTEINPLGQFAKIVVTGDQDQIERFNKSREEKTNTEKTNN